MIALVPSWASGYQEFWNTIRRRNLWFIKLRYGAVLMLTAFLLSAEYLLNLEFTTTQIEAIIIITASILVYNVFLHWVRRFLKCTPRKFNPLHFSLVQILLDLFALELLVHFTGGIETPLYMLFIFHMIIGSLILPGRVIYSVALGVIILFTGLVFSEYLGLLPHHHIKGLLKFHLHTNFEYTAAFASVFSFMIFISVLIGNRIANQLYKMEQELVESINKLNEAEEEKQKYIMGVVHEIKTPLAAVHSYLDLVLDKILGPLDIKTEEKLNRARTRSAEAIGMINNVLKISNLRLLDRLSKTEFEVEDLVLSVIEKQKVTAGRKNVQLVKVDKRNEKKPYDGDKFLIELAISNLVGNAIKYVRLNGRIEVSLKNTNGGLEIEVADNGIGIPEQDLKKIFKDFYRASNIKSNEQEGIGLGLSIVKQVVKRHGGKVSAESPSRLGSEEYPGAAFKMVLPYNSI